MKVLFDTSALVAAIWAEHPSHRGALEWVLSVRRGDHAGVISQHSLLEAYAALTGMPSRPKLDPAVVRPAILEAVSGFQIQETGSLGYQSILERAEVSNLSGGIVYDLLIWAAAEQAEVDLVLTANVRDFRRFESQGAPKVQALE